LCYTVRISKYVFQSLIPLEMTTHVVNYCTNIFGVRLFPINSFGFNKPKSRVLHI
jgi:hypothetical protein